MLSTILRPLSRRACTAAVLALAAVAGVAKAEEKSPYSVSMGLDAQSHFISYGFDVWGGGNDANPFSDRSTVFGYITVNAALADNLTASVNLWGDVNDNATSGLGGDVQEIDFNTGLTYTIESFSIGLTHGYWNYAGDEEKILDLVVGFADGATITQTDAFSLNPSVVFHWRYDGNGPQSDGIAVVPGIKPSFTLMKESKYPITLAVPISFAIFESGFQGGDSGFGFFTAGLTASVPLAFIPEKYGAWTASAGVSYWNTPDDTNPLNPEESFVTTFLSVGFSF